ncbi:MAG: lysophospholipase [Anaerolineales bacterium]|nr:lysophospholipase [Anaerolineales bacterium]
MKHFESTWNTQDNLSLFVQGWEPEPEPKAVICLVHGLGEHSGRYAHVAETYTEAGYAVLSFDLRGHGKSGGQRGHTPSFEAFMQDIDLLFQEASQRYPAKPQFLYGHSLGGILVLNYALRRKPKLEGVIATSSGLRTALEEQKSKVAFAKIAGSLLPSMSLVSGLDPAAISRDPAVVEAYRQDALVHNKVTLGMAKALTETISWAFAHAPEFALPLLLVHGSGDALAYPKGSQEFAKLVKGEVTLKIWEGLSHETHNEPEKAEVLAYNLGWMDSKVSA